ncbi:MAG TPA: hypothetical protein VFT75_18240 [Nocardioidaceae bacterium]|nr:hypothetical protein [Nocardioidaceae bacterium]
MRVVIEAFGEREMSREILRITDRAIDPTPVFGVIYADFLRYEAALFDTEGALADKPWAPLKPATVAYKQRKGLDPRILHATLTLRDSLTDPNSEDAKLEITPDSVFMGSDVPYGVYHQSRGPRKHLPRRPPVMLTSEVRVDWIKKLQRWLVRGEL